MNGITTNPTLSEHAYSVLCECLFRLWAQHVRRMPETARKIRALLACTHAVWSADNACPNDYADGVLQRAQEILELAYKKKPNPDLRQIAYIDTM